MPSRPINPTSTCLPLGCTATTDANPASGKYAASIRLLGLSRDFRKPRVTHSRSGSSKLKSSVERDSSNLLRLRGIARFLTVQAGALFSLSHRRLQARASVDDAPIVRPQQHNCQLRTDSDRLPARQTIQMAQRWTKARPSPTSRARFAPRRVPLRGALASDHLLELFSHVGFVDQLNGERVCTDSDRVQARQATQRAQKYMIAGGGRMAAGG